MFQTIDACALSYPPKIEIIKVYSEIFNNAYLLIIKNFWERCYQSLTPKVLLNLATFLFDFEAYLNQFGVTDRNFSVNGREIIKIFVKKSFYERRKTIEIILKNERLIKAIYTKDNILVTKGPLELNKLNINIIELSKGFKSKYIREQILNLVKESIFQYIIGEDIIISRKNLQLEKEFLVAIANNTIKINLQINDIINSEKQIKILNDNEIIEAIGEKELSHSFILLMNSSITRLVQDNSDHISEMLW